MGLSPVERWSAVQPMVDNSRRLLASYLANFGNLASYLQQLELYSAAYLKQSHREDVKGLSQLLSISEGRLMAANLYYDLLKFVLGSEGFLSCSAFALDTENGPLHARNLDWSSQDLMLRDYTVVCEFEESGGDLFRAVSWPGFAAVLSGVAPGRFAVTLNAVVSKEEPAIAKPISFLIREVLEEASDYRDAVEMLKSTPIAADCLLLVSGTRKGEMCVIERTPRRGAVRRPESDFLVVTNDYRVLEDAAFDWGSDLESTSCSRFERVEQLILRSRPRDERDCFRILSDAQVQNEITMQQMVMCAGTGELHVRLPEPTPSAAC